MFQDIPDYIKIVPCIPVNTLTGSLNSTSFSNVGYVGDILFVADIGAGGGTAPTLQLQVQDSADNSSFSNITGNNQIANVTTSASLATLVVPQATLRQYVRIIATVGGSSPSYLLSVSAICTKKY